MTKTIMITGATDGIGFETAKMIAAQGHTLLLHGRSAQKLEHTAAQIANIPGAGKVHTYRADLTDLSAVRAMANEIKNGFEAIDVLINNAGVFVTSHPITADGYDTRFIVNAVAPYLLTKLLLPMFSSTGRVVNLSSAAQSPVQLDDFLNKRSFSDNAAYAQSKLALTMWSAELGQELDANGPSIIAVNPASFLGSKMVKDAYGQSGKDLQIGADILTRAALSEEFADASGRYYDNDRKAFAQPHPDALDSAKNKRVVEAVEHLIS
ncbi:SDR family NAD(P)-dependent oxidoreductase [uncultured Erythrobacter sp.]|uniref:SDR family NAD(P)-dependent oxidoreductase n=1 Tax=uncultured Erythrobacter sp. TaxID=263913 RepID=UPI0026391204|nr:SDR family NAD(P)-dependent oxidoreductase [uncultured Erythrobacter sp.]